MISVACASRPIFSKSLIHMQEAAQTGIESPTWQSATQCMWLQVHFDWHRASSFYLCGHTTYKCVCAFGPVSTTLFSEICFIIWQSLSLSDVMS